MNIALIGYGKMGKEIERIALKRKHNIVCIIDKDNIDDMNSPEFRKADVAIEFSTPDSALSNVKKAFANCVKVVSGTTGWYEQNEEEMRELCGRGNTLLWASNFSLGVAIFSAVNKYLARIMNDYTAYDVVMNETHHIHKLDAPSGTAITLANTIIDNVERKDSWAKGSLITPEGVSPSEDIEDNKIKINSIREGEVFGIHDIEYSSEADEIKISHLAKNRSGFALGAVMAAEYAHKHHGLLTIKDLYKFLND